MKAYEVVYYTVGAMRRHVIVLTRMDQDRDSAIHIAKDADPQWNTLAWCIGLREGDVTLVKEVPIPE